MLENPRAHSSLAVAALSPVLQAPGPTAAPAVHRWLPGSMTESSSAALLQPHGTRASGLRVVLVHSIAREKDERENERSKRERQLHVSE